MPTTGRCAFWTPAAIERDCRAFVESLGSLTFAYFPYPGLEEPLTCQFEGRNGCDRLRVGTALDLQFPAEAIYVFDEQGQAFRRLAAPELGA